MKVYQTDAQGYFVGVTTADADPLNPTEWLIPAGCVVTEPHDVPDNSRVKWNGSRWVNETIPVEPEPEEPEPITQDVLIRHERNVKLATEVDPIAGNTLRWAALDAETQTAWAKYRQDLLDVPSQEGFPHNITWPEAPSHD